MIRPEYSILMDISTMKRLKVVALSILLLCCVSVAGEKVVSVSIADLQASPEILTEHQYVSTGQPDELLLSAAKEAGYVAVIDLRLASEDRGLDEASTVETLGMDYYLIEVAGAAGVTFKNAEALDTVMAETDGPVLLHCKSANRVGALLALRASMKGASDEEAIAIGKASGLGSLESVVLEQLTRK